MATAVTAPSIDSYVSSFVARKQKLLINGKWVEAASGKTFASYNPATGDVLANVAEGDRDRLEESSKGLGIGGRLPKLDRVIVHGRILPRARTRGQTVGSAWRSVWAPANRSPFSATRSTIVRIDQRSGRRSGSILGPAGR